MLALSRVADSARREPNRLSRLPAALENGAAAVVRALRRARAAFRSLPLVRAVAGCAEVSQICGLARGRRSPSRARTQVRRPDADRRRSGGRDGGHAPSVRRTVGLRPDPARTQALVGARLQSKRSVGARAGPTVAYSRAR